MFTFNIDNSLILTIYIYENSIGRWSLIKLHLPVTIFKTYQSQNVRNITDAQYLIFCHKTTEFYLQIYDIFN